MIRSVIFFVLTLMVTDLFAQTLRDASEPTDRTSPKTMTVEDFERIARRNNPTLSIAAARMSDARGQRIQAGLYPNPVVGYHATEIGNRGTSGQQGGFFSQRVVTAGKLSLDQAIADKALDTTHHQFHAQQQRVLSDIRVRFYEVLVAQKRIELTQQLVYIADERVEAIETLIEGRHAAENDLLQAEIKADESHILLDNQRNEYVESWRRLAAVIGVPDMRASLLSGDLDEEVPQHDWEDCYAMVLAGNPALEAAKSRVQQASMVVRRAKKEPIPDIDVSVSIRQNNITGNDNANVQIGIPIPIFNKNQGNIRSAEAKWIAACKDVKRIELELQDRLAVAYRRYANARQQADRYRERIVPRAERSVKLVTGGYEQGQVDYLTLLTAQQTYLQVNLSFLSSLRELRTASSLIEGQLLSDSLVGVR